jgi:hypothetical protein
MCSFAESRINRPSHARNGALAGCILAVTLSCEQAAQYYSVHLSPWLGGCEITSKRNALDDGFRI